MTAYQCILVPLDGSEAGEDALPYAAALAKAVRLPLRLVSVVPTAPAALAKMGHHSAMWLEEPALRAREHYLQLVAQRFAHQGLAASAAVASGDPVHEILGAIHETDTQFVALSTHGRGAVERLLLGSVADQVMRLSSVPVLLARRQVAGSPDRRVRLSKVAVALDGSPAAEEALPLAADLVRDGGQLVLVQVVPTLDVLYEHPLPAQEGTAVERELSQTVEEYLAQAKRLVKEGLAVRTAVCRGPIAATLRDWLATEQIDLLVMTTRGLGGWQRLLVGSVAERMIRLGVPTLLIKPHSEKRGEAQKHLTNCADGQEQRPAALSAPVPIEKGI